MILFPASRAPAALIVTARRCATVASCATFFFAASGSSFGQSPVQEPSPAQNSSPVQDPVIARVGDAEIRQSDLRLAEEDMGKDLPAAAQTEANRREYLITFLSDMILLSKAAAAHHVAEDDEVRRRMEFTRSKALMDKLLAVTAEAAVTEAAVRKAYDQYLEKNPPEPELHLRYILFRFPSLDDKAAVEAAEAKANAALKQIADGEEFGTVSRKMSDDPGAKIDSGDLGYLTRRQMGKEYADVVFTSPKGKASEPVKTGFGWHIIRVEDERIREPETFDRMRETLATYLSRTAQFRLVAELRQATPMQRLDQAPAAAPAK
jgi:peptidyl-prolyl cis-trans isomerase C